MNSIITSQVLATDEALTRSDFVPLSAPRAASLGGPSLALDALSFGVVLKKLTPATFTPARRAQLVATLHHAFPGASFAVIGEEAEDDGVGAWIRATIPDLAVATPQALTGQLLHNLTGLVPPSKYGEPHLEGYSAPYLVCEERVHCVKVCACAPRESPWAGLAV